MPIELITTLAANPLVLALLLLTLTILVLCGVSFKFNFKRFSIAILKPSRVGELIIKAANISEEITKDICRAENSVLKNQMSYGEKVLDDISELAHINKHDLYITKLKLKIAFKENGIGDLDAEAFSRYVGLKIDMVRSELKLVSQDPYLTSPDFSDKVGDIFNHSLNCYKYWQTRIKELENQLANELNKISLGG